MASSAHFFLLFLLNFFISGSLSQNPILPKAAIIPVTKDFSTIQYVAEVFMGENLAPVKLVVDLNSPFVWADCDFISGFRSQQPITSSSLKCSMAKSIGGCSKGVKYSSKTCTLQAENTVSKISTSVELNEDAMAVHFWDGVGLDSFARIENFMFSCAPNLLLKGLANGVTGMLGLGNSRISLPSQISTSFGFFGRKFSLCLSPSSKGAIFLGGNLYESGISSSMMYTPLVSNKSGLKEGYYIQLKSMKVSGKKLSFPQKGILGAKISTIVPYTTMESKIYGRFVEAYVEAAKSMNMTLVPSVAPFEVCFSSKGLENQRVGPNVPILDLILQSEMVKWRIHGRNSMVDVGDDVMCLAFLDGGLNPKDSIVIGGYQMEDYLLEFNLGNSMLGLSSSLLLGQRSCSDFEGFGVAAKIT